MKKRLIALLLIGLITGNFAACQSKSEIDDVDIVGNIVNVKEEKSQKDDRFRTIKKEEDGSYVTTYPFQNFTGLKAKEDESAYVVGWDKTCAGILNAVGSDGLIVAGYAYGDREGHYGNGEYTLTQFKVEHVFYGQTDAIELIISEAYVVVANDEGSHIYSLNGEYTMLEDHSLVLLFLGKSQKAANRYYPVFYEIPLPDDYMDYNEEYLTSFCNFYRGERSVYEYPEQVVREKDWIEADGLATKISHVYGGSYWPERQISNESLLEEMDDNLIIYTVRKYHVKIWPMEHREYAAASLPKYSKGLVDWSYPPEEH